MAAILRQECAWFDQVNYTELSSKLARETASIQKGYSEKAGGITLAFGTFISGLVVGFFMGWSLALALMVMIPFIGFVGWLFTEFSSSGMQKSLIAYSTSAGYAE